MLMLVWSAVLFVGWIVGPFLAAGTMRWPACWVYFTVLGAGLFAHRAYVARRNPELLERRKRVGAGTKTWDMVWNVLFWPLMIAVPVVAGLGVRLAWPAIPVGLCAVGVLFFAAGMVLSARAMACNPHFEGTVRIQGELDHRVIDTGPYRVIRHPGYAGLCLWALATPFLVLSWLALIPAGVVIIWVIIRTVLEDAVLHRELAGYADFARRTRFRLLPGIW